jgi:hypothetical protein
MLPNPQRKAAVSVMHVRQPIAAIVTLGYLWLDLKKGRKE